MAPMALEDTFSVKRTSTVAEFNSPCAKRPNRSHAHHHSSKWNSHGLRQYELPVQDQDAVQSLLTRSIGLALDAVGFSGAEPIAVESFRAEVEEYIAHFVADIRQSMLSSRRVQAIPQDFLQALHMNQLSLRSLIPHLDPPVHPSRSQFSLETTTIDGPNRPKLAGRILGKQPHEPRKSYVPRHFPDFPSKHSYKATAEFSELEKDPRKIRELAMEEGRLGEIALRRLLGAASSQIHVTQPKTGDAKKNTRIMRDELWKETMLAVAPDLDSQPGVGDSHQDPHELRHGQKLDAAAIGKRHISSAVSADRRHWRKNIVAPRQKHVQSDGIT